MVGLGERGQRTKDQRILKVKNAVKGSVLMMDAAALLWKKGEKCTCQTANVKAVISGRQKYSVSPVSLLIDSFSIPTTI